MLRKSKGWLVILALFVVAVWNSPAVAQTVLKMGIAIRPQVRPGILAMEKFADYVKEKTDGKVHRADVSRTGNWARTGKCNSR